MNTSKSICVRNHSNSTLQIDADSAHRDADFVVIATPTNHLQVKLLRYRMLKRLIERVLQVNPNAIISSRARFQWVMPEGVRRRYDCTTSSLCTRILRESKALYDNLYPSRIISWPSEDEVSRNTACGTSARRGHHQREHRYALYGAHRAAEAVAFANTYLPFAWVFQRTRYLCWVKRFRYKVTISGVGLDPRIGAFIITHLRLAIVYRKIRSNLGQLCRCSREPIRHCRE